jgi:hypothetical protein
MVKLMQSKVTKDLSWKKNKLALVGVHFSSKIKPPAGLQSRTEEICQQRADVRLAARMPMAFLYNNYGGNYEKGKKALFETGSIYAAFPGS